ncbi:PKD domain-containing protein [Candidatus Bathyarchaeota archaeon]|nr:PKD domain-containing protein [Candidatus Bathyarchaeota archaeon]
MYIGFSYGSASLSQNLPYNYGNPYYYWVVAFFYYALTTGQSINQALNSATALWGDASTFGNSQLRNGFTAHWDYFSDQPDCRMAIYGNGNIHLQYFSSPPNWPTTPSVSGPTAGSSGNSYEFSAFAGNPYGENVQYTFDWGDGSPQTVTDWYSDGQTAYASHTWSSGGVYSVTVRAQSASGGWSGWSNPVSINIDQQSVWLDIEAKNEAGVQLNSNIYVDGNWVGTGYAGLQVSYGWHYIEADSYVWDDYYGTYVFPVSGVGNYYVTGYTYHPIIYSY